MAVSSSTSAPRRTSQPSRSAPPKRAPAKAPPKSTSQAKSSAQTQQTQQKKSADAQQQQQQQRVQEQERVRVSEEQQREVRSVQAGREAQTKQNVQMEAPIKSGDLAATQKTQGTQGPQAVESTPRIQELRQQEKELRSRADNVQQRTDAYARGQEQVVAHNLSTINQMATQDAQANVDAKRTDRNPYNNPSPFHQAGAKDLTAEQRDKYKTMTEETVRQGREGVRSGNVSPTINPADYSNVKTGAEAGAQMKFEQQLQNADIPENFNGHSPRNEGEVRALQGMDKGTATPEQNTNRAVLNARAGEVGDKLADMTPEQAGKALTDPEVGKGRGIGEGTGNMRDVPHEIAKLENDLKAHNEQRAEAGLEPIKLDGLDQANDRLQKLDDNIAKFGAQVNDSLGGLSTGQALPPFNQSNIADERQRSRDAIQQGRAIAMPKVGMDGKLTFEPPKAPGTGEVPDSGTTQAERDELVRINDSRNLLRGNQSGYSFKDIPMSPQMRAKLEGGNAILGQKETMPTARNIQQEQIREQFGLHPTNNYDHTGLSTTDKVDRAALVPAEQRADYLNAVNKGQMQKADRMFDESVAISKVDASELAKNSIVDSVTSIDPVSYAMNLKQNAAFDGRMSRPSQKIGESADRMGDNFDKSADARSAINDERYSDAMSSMRGITQNNRDQALQNSGHLSDVKRTRLQTAQTIGMSLAALPMAFTPGARGAARGAMNSVRRGLSRTLGRGGSKAMNSAARTATKQVDMVDNAVQRSLKSAPPPRSTKAATKSTTNEQMRRLENRRQQLDMQNRDPITGELNQKKARQRPTGPEARNPRQDGTQGMSQRDVEKRQAELFEREQKVDTKQKPQKTQKTADDIETKTQKSERDATTATKEQRKAARKAADDFKDTNPSDINAYERFAKEHGEAGDVALRNQKQKLMSDAGDALKNPAIGADEIKKWQGLADKAGTRASLDNQIADRLADVNKYDPARAQKLAGEVGVQKQLKESLTDPKSAWRQRVDDATPADYDKHTRVGDNMSQKEINDLSKSASQYRRDLVEGKRYQELERRALQEGIEVKDANGTSYRLFRSETPVGWDGGEPTNWIRAEMTSGDVFHGHPMSPSRVRKYLPDAS
jgi:hypothetical protein